MIDILPGPENVVAMRLSGTLTAEDYDAIEQALNAALSKSGNIGVYLDMTEFTDLTFQAMGRDMKMFASKLGDLGRFKRYAAVTDKNWMRLIVSASQPLLPMIEGRTYAPEEREAALAWVSGVS